MAAGLGGVRCEFVGLWVKVTSKTRFDILLVGGVAFMKNVTVTFSVPKPI